MADQHGSDAPSPTAPTRHICLSTIGTRGDILPFLLIARKLIAQGQSVTVLANANWRGLFEDIGADFIEIAPQDPPQSARDDVQFFKTSILPSFRKTFDAIAELRARHAQIIVVYRAGMAGAIGAAETFGLPSVNIMLQPMQMKSTARPPWPLTGLAQNRMAGLNKKTLIPALYAAGELRSPYQKWVNDFRAQIGLPKARLFAGQRFAQTRTLMLCPEWFAMPQADWGARVDCLGFPFAPPDSALLDTELAGFIQKNGTPIVFTPGTGVSDISEMFAAADALCEDLGKSGIFLSRSAETLTAKSGALMSRSYVPLEALLPKACLLVHHGGIGTTAQAIRAGIPQIIRPNRFDQPDNAQRIAELGLGAAVFQKHLTRPEWAQLARGVLTSETVRAQARSAAEDLRKSRAAQDAAALILDVMKAAKCA